MTTAAAELSAHENGKETKAVEDNVQNARTGTKSVEQAMGGARKEAEGYLQPCKKTADTAKNKRTFGPATRSA
ncbi:MAG: hypothetical protein LKJ21_01590 [Oscillospiraceae bacterium]|jgi:hypothetical protein|nr:hypothetical protein [Oscillospiraceae bacterium]MCI1991367.1 hypothetical protein [Oscillospiraceae bacterium]MCI2034664.1 hypothetical protein [Oscillospiraceae bacterium]